MRQRRKGEGNGDGGYEIDNRGRQWGLLWRQKRPRLVTLAHVLIANVIDNFRPIPIISGEILGVSLNFLSIWSLSLKSKRWLGAHHLRVIASLYMQKAELDWVLKEEVPVVFAQLGVAIKV